MEISKIDINEISRYPDKAIVSTITFVLVGEISTFKILGEALTAMVSLVDSQVGQLARRGHNNPQYRQRWFLTLCSLSSDDKRVTPTCMGSDSGAIAKVGI